MLIGDILRHSARRAPHRVAIIEDQRQITYADLDAQANRIANALRALGYVPQAKIAMISTSRLEYAAAYFGIARSGCISAHISTRGTVDEISYMLDKVRADALLFEPRFGDIVLAASKRVASLRHLIPLGKLADDKLAPTAQPTLGELAGRQPESEPDVEIDENAPVAITFTGGTTGFPKAVVASHKARCATAFASAIDFGLDERDVVAAATPLFHAAGLYVWFTTALMQGATVVMQNSWDPVAFINIVERNRVTAAFLVPSQLNELISDPSFSPGRLSSLKKIGYAGAPIGRALFDRIRSAFPNVEFTENYGQSETCPITVRCPWHPEDKLGTVGRPVFNADVKIVDRQHNSLPSGQIGDIMVQGEHLFTEYFDDPEQTAAAFPNEDGWLWTGDLGFLDQDGFLTLVDRSKDMLVSGGENIYPAEIENVLYGHDSVAECAVFGIPDERLGEVPAAHIVLKPDARVSEDELAAFCAKKLARHKVPKVVELVAKLPRTAVGKIRKSALREPYWQGYDRKI